MQKILVTGANGFVGYYFIQQLIAEGYRVYATGKGENRLPYTDANFSYRSLDYTSSASVINVLSDIRPQVIVHLGAISKPDECEQNREQAYRANVTGTTNLLEAAKAFKAHFVFLSTDFVFSGTEPGLRKETDARAPVNYYGQTKVLCEDAVMAYPFAHTIVRTSLVYGKTFSGRENIVTNTASALQQGKTLKIFDDQQRTPTYVKDLASGLVAIIKKGATGIYHLSGYEEKTPYDVAVETAIHLGLNASLITAVKANEFDQPAARPANTCFDISKARKELDYQPLSFADGLKRTFGA